MCLYQLQYNKELKIANNKGGSRKKKVQLSKGIVKKYAFILFRSLESIEL